MGSQDVNVGDGCFSAKCAPSHACRVRIGRITWLSLDHVRNIT
jgi:hypothetical protein